ncbi:unnamed protein product [marine sediment metagenome]|uniref:Uncharacterized protein n=1 Tax=marine sediment metagenome TaxID=412755 RepID=X1DRR5_9ZZZZ
MRLEMPKENDEVKIKSYKVILERLRFKAKEFITKEMLTSVNVEFLESHFNDGISFNWHAAIAGQNLRTIRYPKDWWQAFKERWFPEKFKERWPIEYKIIDIYALYPSIAMPDKFTGIHIQETLSNQK